MKPLRALINKNNLKYSIGKKESSFKISKKDLKGELTGVPVGIVVRMLEEAEFQGNKPNIKVFQRNCIADREQGGFDWDKTESGRDFWNNILILDTFDLFFVMYPEYKKYNL